MGTNDWPTLLQTKRQSKSEVYVLIQSVSLRQSVWSAGGKKTEVHGKGSLPSDSLTL